MDFLSEWSPLRWRVILVEVGHHSLVPASLLWAERATNEVQKYNSVHDPSALPPPSRILLSFLIRKVGRSSVSLS